MQHKAYFIIKCQRPHATDGIVCWRETAQPRGYKTVASVRVLCPRDHSCLGALAAAQHLWLLPSITREDWTVYCSPGNDRNSKFKGWFLLNAYHFCIIVKQKSPKSNHLSWEPSIPPISPVYLKRLLEAEVIRKEKRKTETLNLLPLCC